MLQQEHYSEQNPHEKAEADYREMPMMDFLGEHEEEPYREDYGDDRERYWEEPDREYEDEESTEPLNYYYEHPTPPHAHHSSHPAPVVVIER